MKNSTRRTVTAGLAAVLLAASLAAGAQSWPARRITVLTGAAPGTLTDILTRLMTKALEERLKQPVIVENRQGAGAVLAILSAARSAPDGYTYVLTSEVTLYPEVFNKDQPSFLKDITLVAAFGQTPTILAASTGMKVKTLRELVQRVKENPGKFNAAIGSNTTLALDMTSFLSKNGLDMLQVPYPGMTQATAAMAAGDVQFMLASMVAIRPMIDKGLVVPLGTTSPKRFSLMPELPTLREQGFDTDTLTWFGLFGPNGIPQDIIARVRREVNESMNTPEMAPTLAKFGTEPLVGSLEELMAKVHENSRRYAEIMAQIEKAQKK